jgi:serine/threonine protein kinase
MIGTRIGHFELEEKLGEGAHGTVYRAVNVHDTALQVSVKLVRPELTGDPRFLEALKQECRRLDGLDHRSIVRFRDLIVDGDQVAMVLELLRGQDLFKRIRQGPMPLEEVIHVLEDLLDGLAYAHEHGVLHRDIKPSNIFLCSDDRVKLLDFGVARAADNTEATRTGQLVGTMDYIAPERFTPDGGGPASDVYAVGLVGWEMLAGRAACPAGELSQKLGWHMGVGVPDIRQLRSDCPDGLAKTIATLCHLDASQRPADGRAALRCLQGQPIPVTQEIPVLTIDAPRTVQIDSDVVAHEGVAGILRKPTVTVEQKNISGQRPQTVQVNRPSMSLMPARSVPTNRRRQWALLAAALAGATVLVGGGIVGVGILTLGSSEQTAFVADPLVDLLGSNPAAPSTEISAMAKVLEAAGAGGPDWIDTSAKRIIADTTDERDRRTGFSYAKADIAQFFLRNWAQVAVGEDCTAAAELQAVLDRTDWRGLLGHIEMETNCDLSQFQTESVEDGPIKVQMLRSIVQQRETGRCTPLDQMTRNSLGTMMGGQFMQPVKDAAVPYGLDDELRFAQMATSQAAKGKTMMAPSYAAMQMQGGSTYGLLLAGEMDMNNFGFGLVSAIRRCHRDGAVALEKTMALLDELDSRGLSDARGGDAMGQGLTIRESLVLSVLASAAWSGTMDDEIDGVGSSPSDLAAQLIAGREASDKVRSTIATRLQGIANIETSLRPNRTLYGR